MEGNRGAAVGDPDRSLHPLGNREIDGGSEFTGHFDLGLGGPTIVEIRCAQIPGPLRVAAQDQFDLLAVAGDEAKKAEAEKVDQWLVDAAVADISKGRGSVDQISKPANRDAVIAVLAGVDQGGHEA